MEEYFLKLTPANRKENINFQTIAEKTVHGIPVFEHAENYVNQTENFLKRKKQLKILEITPEYLLVQLSSASKLEMVSKSLAGFSRELLRVDDQRKIQGKNRLFDKAIYNHGLFRSEIVRNKDEIIQMAATLSDVAALKLVVELFYGEATKTKEDAQQRTKAILAIKEILTDYFQKI